MLRQIQLLQPYEQVVLLDRLLAAFAADPSGKSDDRVRAEKMVAAYRAIETVYERLDLPFDEPITAQEFSAANERLGSDWRWARVHRAWGSWRRAISVFLGGPAHSRAGDLALRIVRDRTNTDRRPARESLRLWLETNPKDRGMHAYNDWARHENEGRGAALKHLSAHGVKDALSVPFPRAVEQAEREIATGTADDILEGASITVDGHRLVTLDGVGRLTNRGRVETRRLLVMPDFPPWVARVGPSKLWLKDDIERWQAGAPCTSTEGMLAHLVWDVAALAARIEISARAVQVRHTRRARSLPPSGRPRLHASWWEARAVEAWLRAHRDHDPRQR